MIVTKHKYLIFVYTPVIISRASLHNIETYVLM